MHTHFFVLKILLALELQTRRAHPDNVLIIELQGCIFRISLMEITVAYLLVLNLAQK